MRSSRTGHPRRSRNLHLGVRSSGRTTAEVVVGDGRSASRGLKDPWRAYLRKRRLKTTQQREAIVDAFLQSNGHVGLEDLLSSARKRNPGVGLATVYRTVKLLEDAGLAAARQFGSGQTLYELAGQRAHHDHIICQQCHFIVEFESDEIEKMQTDIARRHGFAVTQH